MYCLKSMYVSNDLYQSNQERCMIFSKDGSELICVLPSLQLREIPNGVHVIKKIAFYFSTCNYLLIPSSVEAIEEEIFQFSEDFKVIEFDEGSKLNSLAFNAFSNLSDLFINNENFVKRDDGVVMSLNPPGIVFVPKILREFEVPADVQVIYSFAFYYTKIKMLKFPKSLKKICSFAFYCSSLESVTFEEETVLGLISEYAFSVSDIIKVKLPQIRGELKENALKNQFEQIEFPQNFNPIFISDRVINENDFKKVICPASSLQAIAHICFFRKIIIK